MIILSSPLSHPSRHQSRLTSEQRSFRPSVHEVVGHTWIKHLRNRQLLRIVFFLQPWAPKVAPYPVSCAVPSPSHEQMEKSWSSQVARGQIIGSVSKPSPVLPDGEPSLPIWLAVNRREVLTHHTLLSLVVQCLKEDGNHRMCSWRLIHRTPGEGSEHGRRDASGSNVRREKYKERGSSQAPFQSPNRRPDRSPMNTFMHEEKKEKPRRKVHANKQAPLKVYIPSTVSLGNLATILKVRIGTGMSFLQRCIGLLLSQNGCRGGLPALA